MYTFSVNIGITIIPRLGKALAIANCVVEKYVNELVNIKLFLIMTYYSKKFLELSDECPYLTIILFGD